MRAPPPGTATRGANSQSASQPATTVDGGRSAVQASIDVRYQSGLRATTDEMILLWERWEDLCLAGTLGSDPLPPGFEASETGR